MTDPELQGRPAADLTDQELEQQGAQAHATRDWVFLHGSAEQFARHTSRMLELEREYLRRFPKRTWQGSGGATGNREAGLVRIATADLHKAHPPMLITEGHDRVLTAAGRVRLAEDDA